MIVDYQTHWYPPAYLESVLGRSRAPRAERVQDVYRFEAASGETFTMARRFWDLETQIADMDEHGVDVMVCSPTNLAGTAGLSRTEASETIALLNEEMARAEREYRGRFVGLAMLPMEHPQDALRALDAAVTELGLRGVCVMSNVAGGPIVSDQLLPIYRRIAELGVPLFLHPADHSRIHHQHEPLCVERGVNWLMETTKAALSLIVSGTLDEVPDLTVVHPHAGGVLPYVVDRMGSAMQREPPTGAKLPLREYLRRSFYVDSCSETPAALKMSIDLYGLDRVLLATDVPWQSRQDRLAYVRENSTGEQAQAIFEHNALPGLNIRKLPTD